MALFKEKSERKSLIVTTIINGALIAVLFIFGLTYLDPPEEGGIAINFGNSEVGYGDVQPTTPPKTAPSKTETQPEETTKKEEETPSTQEEEVVTQDIEEAPVLNQKEEPKPAEKTEKPEKKEEPKPDPKPEQSTSDALESILSGKKQDGQGNQGEGNDQTGGDKGDPSGDPNASSYYGQGTGTDGDGNYKLGGRQALNKQKYTQECNESGTVVVEIKVDRTGKVVQAKPGVKGTTNTSSCLLNPAKKAALETRFNSDAKAPSIQTGLIIYEFKLSD